MWDVSVDSDDDSAGEYLSVGDAVRGGEVSVLGVGSVGDG